MTQGYLCFCCSLYDKPTFVTRDRTNCPSG